MEYVFGDTLICDDADSAKKVTFAREIGVKSVTLQGDVYDPSGTLSGGAPPVSNKALISVQELLDIERRLNDATGQLRTLEQEEVQTRASRENWKGLAKELDLKEHEMRLVEEQVGGSNATKVIKLIHFYINMLLRVKPQVATDLDTLKQTIQELRVAVQAAIDKQKTAKEEIKKLEKDMAEFKNNKEGKIDQLKVCQVSNVSVRSLTMHCSGQVDVSKQKAALQKHATTLKLKQKDLQTAKLELG